jgi:hypothetical protein
MASRDASAWIGLETEVRARYHVEVLPWAEVGEHGVGYFAGARRTTLQWASVLHASSAQVGEPEGVCTVVFDLVVERKGEEFQVCRFDADPGPGAQRFAARIVAGLGRSRCSRSLLALSTDGHPNEWLPDLDAVAEKALEDLAWCRPAPGEAGFPR